MDLNISVGTSEKHKILSVAANTVPSYELEWRSIKRVDIFVFTLGEKLSECEVVGWLPGDKVRQAPSVGGKDNHLVDARCVYPMPKTVDFGDINSFVEPIVDVPGVWDYDLGALWTPLGFHVYNEKIKAEVHKADEKIANGAVIGTDLK